jgi:hypothetical protein
MLILFFASKGIIIQPQLPQKQSVNSAYYANTLKTHFRNASWKKKRPELLMKLWFLLQDDAWLHTADTVGRGASRHQWITCRTHTHPAVQTLLHVIFGHFQCLNMSYEDKFSTDSEVKQATSATQFKMSRKGLL